MTRSEFAYYLLEQEGRQRQEEGCKAEDVQKVFKSVTKENSPEEILAVLDRMGELEVDPGFPFTEPTEWAGVVAASPSLAKRSAETHAKDISDLDSRMLGAWLGRCAGCALGKPVEREPYMLGNKGMEGWQAIRHYLKAANAWPLDFYVPDNGVLDGTFDVGCPDSTRQKIKFMETDDDIRYTILGIKILEEKGQDFTTEDVANEWLSTLPVGQTFTAERETYRNLLSIMDLGPFSPKDLEWARGYRNPFREWIGAQIRADGWAYAAAGRPALAAEFAYRDASLSHVKNGIYGEMVFAAAIAAGFTSATPLDALRKGLEYIPAVSRLKADIEDAIELGLQTEDMDELHAELWKQWGRYHGVHTNNNAALVAAAIAWGGEDYEKVIVSAVTGGWDTDCNGATAGSLWGAVYGAKAVPEKWTSPLNDKLFALLPGFHPIAISACAERSVKLAKELR